MFMQLTVTVAYLLLHVGMMLVSLPRQFAT
jgi:hypothetical protein